MFFIGFAVIVVIAWCLGQYDYARLADGKRPIFARKRLYLADGGSVAYVGLGYTVTAMHAFAGGIDLGSPTRTYRVGTTLEYWTPFISRDSTDFIVVTNR
jgi:hypothetical protein